MSRDFIITVSGERAKIWQELFGTDQLCVMSPFPRAGTDPDHPEGAMYYDLDMTTITPEQRLRLVQYIAARFGLSEAEAKDEIDARGVPIAAEGTTLTILNSQKYQLELPLFGDEEQGKEGKRHNYID